MTSPCSPFCARARSLILSGLGAAVLSLLTGVGCGNGLSSVVVQVSGIPASTVRVNAVITANSRTSTVTLERDSSNRFIVSTAMLMPPMLPAPSSTQLALDLPASTSGPLVVRISIESGDITSMTMPPPPPTLTHEGCGRVEIQGAMLYSLPIAVRPQPSPCPY